MERGNPMKKLAPWLFAFAIAGLSACKQETPPPAPAQQQQAAPAAPAAQDQNATNPAESEGATASTGTAAGSAAKPAAPATGGASKTKYRRPSAASIAGDPRTARGSPVFLHDAVRERSHDIEPHADAGRPRRPLPPPALEPLSSHGPA